MAKQVVIDSSVFCKLFLQEDDRQQAIDLIVMLGEKDCQIIVPSLFLYEVLSVATMSCYPTELANDLLIQHQKINLKLIEIDNETIHKAIEITKKGHQNSGYPSFYDSAYHALAIQNSSQFITADKRHKAKAQQFGYITMLADWETIFSL